MIITWIPVNLRFKIRYVDLNVSAILGGFPKPPFKVTNRREQVVLNCQVAFCRIEIYRQKQPSIIEVPRPFAHPKIPWDEEPGYLFLYTLW